MNDSMRQLVQVVNRLSDACVRSKVTLGLELPQICVIGGQSVGKSSVLESIVGKDFLPRGTGIVTRCPIILKCKQSEKEYAEFLHDPGHIFTDFDEVRREIEMHTERLCGANKGITSSTISLTIHSPHVLDLTLVDLPGITRVPVGDQPKDIEQQTLALVRQQVEHPNVIILAVSAANVDLANSDAMKIVREVDPQGKRTIGVLTKLDIMDPGTDAKDVLCNNVFHLKLGYIGVINRSQIDLNEATAIEDVRAKEARFFAEHKSYREFADRMGIPHLQQVLSRELTTHIERTLPDLMAILKTKKRDSQQELNRLQDKVQPENVLDRFLFEYGSTIQTEIKGTPGNVQMTEIAGGARLNSLFYNEFANRLDLAHFIFEDVEFNKKIETTIKNLYAINNGVFIPNQAFNAVSGAIIEKYIEPVTQCVEEAGTLLREITTNAGEMLQEFPRLYEAVQFLVNNHIQAQMEVAKQHLIVHVKAERSFKNTKHEDYIANVTREELPALGANPHTKRPKQNSFRGAVLLKIKGREIQSWVVLSPDTLKCFKTEQEDEDICMVNIDSKVRMRTENGGKDKRIVIARSDGRHVVNEAKTIEFVFKDDHNLEKWIYCFECSGVLPDGEDYEMMFDPRTRRESQSSQVSASSTAAHNPRLHQSRKAVLTKNGPDTDEVETVKQMVRSYLKVVSKTIQDIVPKYIVYLLVENTEHFAVRDLSSRIRTEYNLKSLLERDEAVQQRIEQLIREYSTSEDALRILNDYYAYARTAAY